MQSVFRSSPSLTPWASLSNTLNKAVAPFVAHTDLPVAGNANGKRKRNLDTSPRSSPVPAPKKLKPIATEIGSAVRPAPRQLLRGPDGNAMVKNPAVSAIAPKPVETVQYCTGAAPYEVHGHQSGYAPPSYFWQGQYVGPMQPMPQQAYSVKVGENMSTGSRDGQRVSASCPVAATPFIPPSQPVTHGVVSPDSSYTPAYNTSSLANVQGSSVGPDVVATSTIPTAISPSVDATAPSQSVAPTSSGSSTFVSVHQTKPFVKAKEHISTPRAKAVRKMDVNMDHVRAACTLQIDAAIVFKHNELRLIDLEIAKCQVALEQIRRCQLMPYPALQGFSAEVANHSGPSLLAPAGLVAPQYPAPWGVTDGPYTQHYAPWLIKSGHFDPRLPETGTPIASPYPRDGRATRHSDVTPLSATFPSGRSARASIGRARHSLDAQSAQPQRDPLVIKRNADNQWVKLYCSECQPERSNFANVQGFLNHCRISHKLDYKSHESAAIACGRIVQLSESMIEPEPVSTTVSTPKLSLCPSSLDSFVRSGVHPFIAGSVKGRENKHPAEQLVPRMHAANDRHSTGLSTPTTPTVQPEFKAATMTPYLSQMMAKSGFNADLAATVDATKRKEDLTVYDDSDSESDGHSSKKQKPNRKKGSLSGVKIKIKANTKPSMSTFSTPSFGPLNMESHISSFQPLDSPISDRSGMPTPSEPTDHEMNDSPHAAESNPGLVSDRDEDDDEMDEDESSPTEDSRRVDESEMMIMIEDGEGVTSQVEHSLQRICTGPTETSAC